MERVGLERAGPEDGDSAPGGRARGFAARERAPAWALALF